MKNKFVGYTFCTILFSKTETEVFFAGEYVWPILFMNAHKNHII